NDACQSGKIARALAPATYGGFEFRTKRAPGVTQQRRQKSLATAEMMMDGRVGHADIARDQLHPHRGFAALPEPPLGGLENDPSGLVGAVPHPLRHEPPLPTVEPLTMLP